MQTKRRGICSTALMFGVHKFDVPLRSLPELSHLVVKLFNMCSRLLESLICSLFYGPTLFLLQLRNFSEDAISLS